MKRFFFQAEDGIRDYKVTGVQSVLFRSILMASPDRGGPGGPGAGSSRPVPSASNLEVTAPGWRGAATGQADAARVVERPRPGPPRPPVDPVEHVMGLLRAALGRARAAGIPEERIVVDPGIGFFRDEGIPWHEWDARVLAGLVEPRSEEHTSELQSPCNLVCRLLLEKK